MCNISQIMFALNQNAQFLSIESSVDTKIPTSETRVSLCHWRWADGVSAFPAVFAPVDQEHFLALNAS